MVSPASSSGVTAPRSAAARMPGRKPATRVVGVGAGRDVRDAELGGQRPQHVEQLGLAEVAAVAGVGAVALAAHLVGRRRHVPHAEVGGEPRPRRRARPPAGWATPRSPATTSLGAERADRGREQERRVGAAGERDDHRARGRPASSARSSSRRSQHVAVQPGREARCRSSSTTSAPGRPQLVGRDRPGRHADGDRTRGARTLDVADVVADVDGRAVLAQRLALLPGPTASRPARRPRGRGARGAAAALGSYLPVTTTHRAAVPAYGVDRLARAGQRRPPARPPATGRARGTGRRQRRPGPRGTSARAPRSAAARAGDDRGRVSIGTPVSADSASHTAAIPGPGVDQRHVEVEPDDEGSHPAQGRWLRRAGPAGPGRGR